MVKLLCGLLVLSFSLHSCNPSPGGNSSQQEIHIMINPQKLPPTGKLSEIAKSVRIVPLETNSDCYVESIGRIFFGKEHIVFSTRGSRNDLFLFTINGEFIRKIGRQGKGPGEYVNIRDISVLEDNKMVYVTTGTRGKLLGYSFGGRFIKEFPGKKVAQESKVLSNEQIAYVCLLDYEVKIIDFTNQETKNYLPITPQSKAFYPRFSGDQYSGVFFSATGRDTIWRVDQDSLRPVLIFDFGNGHLSAKEYLSAAVFGKDFPQGKLSISYGTYYGSGYYHTNLMREDENLSYDYFHVFIDEKSRKSWHFANNKKSDDILFCTSTDFRATTPSGEWLSVVGAYELIESLNDIQNNPDFKYSSKLIDQIKKMEEEDNPVLVLYTLL